MDRTTLEADRDTVADRLAPIVRALLGDRPPLAVQGWDGSRTGPPDPLATVVVHSSRALRHLLCAPRELGLARAHVAGDLDIDGDVFSLLALRDHLTAPGEHMSVRLGPSGWLAVVRAARDRGAIGRRPPLPREEARLRGAAHSRRGEHYARTLRAWVANLEDGWDLTQRMAGPGRARDWRLYLAGSALGFESRRTSVHQVLAVRTHTDGRSEMPPTRRGIEADGAGRPA